MKLILPVAVIALVAVNVLGASDNDLANPPQYDKTAYNLFEPMPSDLMRPIYSSVYDGVTDAHTLDAGHVELDTPLINYYKTSGTVSRAGVSIHDSEELYNWFPTVRVGLLNNVELDVEEGFAHRSESFQYNYSAPYAPGTYSEKLSSDRFGSFNLGPVINLWGNDSGPTAFALNPFVTIPTDHGDILSGIDLPFDWNMPLGFYLKVDSQFGFTDDRSHTHYGDFYNDVSIHRALCNEAEAYWYLDSEVTSTPGTPWHGYTGFGLIYKLTVNFQVFASMGFGLNSQSYDYNPRLGLIYRL